MGFEVLGIIATLGEVGMKLFGMIKNKLHKKEADAAVQGNEADTAVQKNGILNDKEINGAGLNNNQLVAFEKDTETGEVAPTPMTEEISKKFVNAPLLLPDWLNRAKEIIMAKAAAKEFVGEKADRAKEFFGEKAAQADNTQQSPEILTNTI
jgi:hypothetical protein